ncbi:hypothetical protein [Dinghuibacter silviterrae]|uniref:Outer membrane protein with beta-barrel domain n=1 Tax=Dinghuibacter silviterrae TaxID=1539049 RepID=A0A4R8DJU7_9BACT|nr:hypothetical protein [Dinghuibacter silviterrae]TDW97280.1 hypothetical protein EDB95_5127 [Dinghuibacter silviterrae]
MRLWLLLFSLLSTIHSWGLGDTTIQQLPAHYADRVQAKAASIDASLNKKTAQYIAKLNKIETRILAKLQKLNPAKAATLSPSPYDKWLGNTGAPTNYVPGLDTMRTSLAFLQQGSSSLSGASTQVNQLQGNLNQAGLIDQYIQQRRQELAGLLSQYSNLPPGVTNEFNEYKETAYYYRAQLQAYKDMLNDPSKLEATALTVLNKVPAFQQFMSRNSILASLFAAPPGGMGAGALPVNLGNLQTRSQVQQAIQQQLAPGGPNAQQALQQQMQAAQGQLQSLQQQATRYASSGSSSDMDLPPGFQPNTQKTKTFLQRLEYGANVQFARAAYDFPATANLGLTLGYKINDKSTVGVGLAYTAGMGTGWNHIQFSNQALGLRSYIDWKIKKTYYVIGGYEENYMTAFSGIADLRDRSAWQPSALMGVEKKYKISSKVQGNIQLLYDVLYAEEVPRGQAIKIRVGYNF